MLGRCNRLTELVSLALFCGEYLFEVFAHRIKQYVFDRHTLNASWSELPASFGLSNMHPIGSPVTRAGKTVGLDKSLHQHRFDRIPFLPVLRKLLNCHTEDHRCQVWHLDPR